ncbi:MAG: glycogen synthase, partial [Candidatus Hydrogenedentes bacterium]|nr:glycogen synthase [Candidatus Hydrogenedentota bacterium]
TTLPDTDIPLYLVEHENYFGRPAPYGDGNHEYEDNAERFWFFSHAALDGIAGIGWRPDVVHCHDWPTAPIPLSLKSTFAHHPFWEGVPSLYTIHNLAYQGRYGAEKMANTGFGPELFSPQCLEYHGDMNLMKGAIVSADQISTVSPRYAREIQTLGYGEGLDGILRNRRDDLRGILNGADYTLWNPATDPHIPANYDREDLAGKATCKRAFQKKLELPKADVPLFGIVSRLVWQKGIDLVMESALKLPEGVAQIVVLGTGDRDIEKALKHLETQRPKDVRVILDFNVPVAHQLQAACDFFLMPSRYEPCGLSQFYSFAYGSIPIVRRSGGLADTVADCNPVNLKRGLANGLSFVPLTSYSLSRRMLQAVALYDDKQAFERVQATGMALDFSWGRSCDAYIKLYRECTKVA